MQGSSSFFAAFVDLGCSLLWAPFAEFAFMRRSLAAALALSLSAAPLGVFLTLRRMSLLGDALGIMFKTPPQLILLRHANCDQRRHETKRPWP